MGDRVRLGFIGMAVSLSLFGPPNHCAAQALLEAARDGHTSSVQSVHTLSCVVDIVQNDPGQRSHFSGKYWREGATARCQYKRGKVTIDILTKDGKFTSLQTRVLGARPPGIAEIRQSSDQRLGDCDVWLFALFTFAGPDPGSLITFDELLKKPHQLRNVKRQSIDGRELIYVSLEHTLSRLEWWFDSKVNYLVRKHTVATKNQPTEIKSVWEVISFKEVAPTIYFPERIEVRSFAGSQPLSPQSITLSNIQVNLPLPKDTFRLRFPAGTEVSDDIRGKHYKVDEDGQPIGPITDIGRTMSSSKKSTSLTETREEPRSLSRWILPMSCAILVVAGVLWLVRRRGQRG